MTYSRVVDPSSGLDRLASVKTTQLSIPELPPARGIAGAFPLERRNVAARERLMRRVRSEFNEMPGLSLTLPQARRLFGLSHDACARILTTLAREGLLRRHDDGTYGRRDMTP